jgi:large subunit ribosomal protein L11
MKENIILTLYIKAGQAESGPPLGTILGNIGVQSIKFCKEFNEYTKELPFYFLLKVKIIITENKSFTFTIEQPPIGSLIYLLKKEEKIKSKEGIEVIINYIFFEDLIKLAKFKFPEFKLERAINIIKGSLFTSNIQIKI